MVGGTQKKMEWKKASGAEATVLESETCQVRGTCLKGFVEWVNILQKQ